MKRTTLYRVAVAALLSVTLGSASSWAAPPTPPPVAERVYLSGTEPSDAVEWDFLCSSGRRSGAWARIPVPSNWEQHGFGGYDYGHTAPAAKHDETGTYKTRFVVPESWKDKHVRLVFEGAMTETSVKINGVSVGAPNLGGYLPFRFNLEARHLHYGEENELEVLVAKKPANASLDKAERKGDYWVFGGIYRPVYLEVLPRTFIDRVAIDARADGRFAMDVFPQTHGAGKLRRGSLMGFADEVTAHVQTLDGTAVGEAMSARVYGGAGCVRLEGRIAAPEQWSPEFPNLYQVRVVMRKGGEAVFETVERFGFRTFELRPEDGLYLNGKKIRVRGINRNVFDPETARAIDGKDAWEDARAIKAMNANLVRSHMPATTTFMEACDELGLMTIVELCNWSSPSIDTPIARDVVYEMVAKYQNHPSVIFWANGNEGGFNLDVAGLYPLLDLQRRPVLHPWLHHEAVDTMHYPPWDTLQERLRGPAVYLPTEFLHGLYDGGQGAGLEDYWNAITQSPYGAGGVLWCWADAAIRRTDLGGKLDTFGNRSADGVVGPNGEKEGSYYTVREIWSPIQIPLDDLPEDFDGVLPVENRYLDTPLSRCGLEWRLVSHAGPDAAVAATVVRAEGAMGGPDVAAGASGTLALPLPADWRSSDALELRATDADGVEIMRWAWAIRPLQAAPGDAELRPEPQPGRPFVIQMGDARWSFSPETGQLLGCHVDGQDAGPTSGPSLYAGNAAGAIGSEHDWRPSVTRVGDAVVIASVSEATDSSFRWTLAPGGRVRLDYTFAPPSDAVSYCAVGFDLPEGLVQGKRWLGDGPFRIWGNRRKGPQHGLWENAYNDTVTGVQWDYPEFKGVFGGVDWMRLDLAGGHTLVVETGGGADIGVLRPGNPEGPRGDRQHPSGPANAVWEYPATGGLFVFHKTPVVGTKSKDSALLGPQSRPVKLTAPITGSIVLRSGRE